MVTDGDKEWWAEPTIAVSGRFRICHPGEARAKWRGANPRIHSGAPV